MPRVRTGAWFALVCLIGIGAGAGSAAQTPQNPPAPRDPVPQRQEIPAGYRDYIRRYFDGIQPDRGAASEEAPAAEGQGEAKQGK